MGDEPQAIGTEERGRRDRAIAVAGDVLKHLDGLRLVTGSYVYEPLGEDWSETSVLPEAGDLRDVVDRVQEVCTVCLLGACLLSKARLYDAVPIASLRGPYARSRIVADFCEVSASLEDVFTVEQQRLMEAAFEQTITLGEDLVDPDHLYGAVVFAKEADPGCEAGEPSAQVVRAVMENLIAHEGVFTVTPVEPPDDDDYWGDDDDEDSEDFF